MASGHLVGSLGNKKSISILKIVAKANSIYIGTNNGVFVINQELKIAKPLFDLSKKDLKKSLNGK